MHDEDLRSALLELTEPRPEPADPAAGVSVRIRRLRQRRRGTAAVLAAAVVTAATIVTGQGLDALRSGGDPGVSGPGVSSPTVAPSARPSAAPKPAVTPTMNDPRKNAKLPPPWKDKEFTKFPERNLYAPQAIYLAQGTHAGGSWAALTYTSNMLSEACIAVESTLGEGFSAGGCFDDWPVGRRADWSVEPVLSGRKPNFTMTNTTLVAGVVSADARSVVIKTKDGKDYRTPAVGTPTSDKLRFFFLVIPRRDAKVVSVEPLDESGALADPPVGLPPTGGVCYEGPREGHPTGAHVCISAGRPETTSPTR